MTVKTQIVILGGGFAGVETARYLDRTAAKRADVEVTLVSRDNFILFTPMLDEVVAGDLEPAHICNPIRKLLRHVTVLSAEIKAIDLTARQVTISYGIRALIRRVRFANASTRYRMSAMASCCTREARTRKARLVGWCRWAGESMSQSGARLT